jgi:hypothetical protein
MSAGWSLSGVKRPWPRYGKAPSKFASHFLDLVSRNRFERRLGQCAQRFAENDINFAVLPHLTDQDLKELGVASLSHRRQLADVAIYEYTA